MLWGFNTFIKPTLYFLEAPLCGREGETITGSILSPSYSFPYHEGQRGPKLSTSASLLSPWSLLQLLTSLPFRLPVPIFGMLLDHQTSQDSFPHIVLPPLDACIETASQQCVRDIKLRGVNELQYRSTLNHGPPDWLKLSPEQDFTAKPSWFSHLFSRPTTSVPHALITPLRCPPLPSRALPWVPKPLNLGNLRVSSVFFFLQI